MLIYRRQQSRATLRIARAIESCTGEQSLLSGRTHRADSLSVLVILSKSYRSCQVEQGETQCAVEAIFVLIIVYVVVFIVSCDAAGAADRLQPINQKLIIQAFIHLAQEQAASRRCVNRGKML